MSSSRCAVALLLILAFLGGCVAPGATVKTNKLGTEGFNVPDVAAIVQKVGDNASIHATDAVRATLRGVGHEAAEPTLGILKDGTLFYAAATFKNELNGVALPLPRTDILRSDDGGVTWKDVSPKIAGFPEHPETGDPMVYVDTGTGRIFDIDQRLLTTCYTVVTSDDKGATWTAPPSPACATPGIADHQTIVASKPRTLPVSPLYPKVVFVCYNIIASSVCVRSLDGGRTFEPTSPVGSLGVDPARVGPGTIKPNTTDPTNPDVDTRVLCSGLVGHLKAAPDGTVYLPRRECDKGLVFITQDDGLSWSKVQVAKDVLAQGGTAGADPTIAIDQKGNAYYVYQRTDGRLAMSYSTDHGAKWSTPVDITAPGLTIGNLPALAAGNDGALALVYYGSNVTGGANATPEDVKNSTWNGYLATITDAATPTPTVTTARVNPANDPLFRGDCGVGRCGSVRDFIDVAVDGDGRPWATFIDACVDKCAASDGTAKDSVAFTGMIATLSDGYSLLDPTQKLPAVHNASGK